MGLARNFSMSRTALFLYHLQMRQMVNDALVERFGLGEIAQRWRRRLGRSQPRVPEDMERC